MNPKDHYKKIKYDDNNKNAHLTTTQNIIV